MRLSLFQPSRIIRAKASPRTATRIDKHFLDSDDPGKEAELERRLNEEFESPVNRFVFEIADPGYVATDLQRRQLTFYVTLLFLRSEARRKASRHTLEVSKMAVEKFLHNEKQLQTVVAKWNIDRMLSGKPFDRLITGEDVIGTAREMQSDLAAPDEAKKSYVRMIENAMRDVDHRLMTGQWKFLRTVPESPFVISDAPVVTWERRDSGMLSYGMGFHRANVEVFLPISPLICLHILPKVDRTRDVVPPSVEDLNAAQGAFAGRYCFASVNSPAINEVLQSAFGKAELGAKSFTVWHRNYDDSVYELLMNNGRFVEPPRL
jgi:hypothetical protein